MDLTSHITHSNVYAPYIAYYRSNGIHQLFRKLKPKPKLNPPNAHSSQIKICVSNVPNAFRILKPIQKSSKRVWVFRNTGANVFAKNQMRLAYEDKRDLYCSLDLRLLQWLIAHIQEFILVFMKTMLFCLVLYHSNPIHHPIVNIGMWTSRYLSEIDNKPICHLNTILLLWHFPLKMLIIHSSSLKYSAVTAGRHVGLCVSTTCTVTQYIVHNSVRRLHSTVNSPSFHSSYMVPNFVNAYQWR